MSTPENIKHWIDQFGSEDAKFVGHIIMLNTAPLSMSRHDGMEALRRLAERELEDMVMEALVQAGYEITRLKTELLGVVITIIKGSDATLSSRNVSDVVQSVARLDSDVWPPELRDKVLMYLLCKGAVIDKPIKKGGPPTELEKHKRR